MFRAWNPQPWQFQLSTFCFQLYSHASALGRFSACGGKNQWVGVLAYVACVACLVDFQISDRGNPGRLFTHTKKGYKRKEGEGSGRYS